jgi:Spo0E like sporulation regulatory protein.
MEKIRLLIKIERLRKRLNKFTLFRSLSDPEVVLLSQELDQLLNQYYILSEV